MSEQFPQGPRWCETGAATVAKFDQDREHARDSLNEATLGLVVFSFYRDEEGVIQQKSVTALNPNPEDRLTAEDMLSMTRAMVAVLGDTAANILDHAVEIVGIDVEEVDDDEHE